MPKERYIIGIDEVGRGPLAGPVTVCAFLIPRVLHDLLPRQKDSKQLRPKLREVHAKHFRAMPRTKYALVSLSASVIDRIGIERATKIAVARTLWKLDPPASSLVLLDGRLSAPKSYAQQTIVRGDELIPAIAIASIIAKVHRDRLMKRYAVRYPGYGFERHAGYGTKEHYRMLRRRGLSPIHRRSFLSTFHSRD